ncbi:MAG: hypothetical protein KC910_31725 [Candidatus Eremiobacteraeota bacterium]|nr:hypothetical protein [Candidatus Eremiobacteraeota bacterium]
MDTLTQRARPTRQPQKPDQADRVENGDWQREQRKQWLRSEISRISYELSNLQTNKQNMESEMTQLSYAMDRIRNEMSTLGYQINDLTGQLQTLEAKRHHAKEKRRYAETPEERNYWNDVVWRLNDEIWRVSDNLSRARYRYSDLETDLRYKNTRHQELYYAKGDLENRMINLRQTLDQYREELRRLEQGAAPGLDLRG